MFWPSLVILMIMDPKADGVLGLLKKMHLSEMEKRSINIGSLIRVNKVKMEA